MELRGSVEIVPHRLYWAALHARPAHAARFHFFNIDEELVYEPFHADFGPLNLSMIHRYCKLVASKLADPTLQGRAIVHYCSQDPKRRANAACLIGAYQVIALGKSAEAAFEPFADVYPPFLPFRDATSNNCTFHLTILDCLRGLEKSIELRWFDWTRFDVESYDFFGRVENGDMNWIIPDKFLAFAGPCPTPVDPDGYPAFTPEDYVPIFREAGLGLVVRLNKKQYDHWRFTHHGIKHVDLYFRDGSCPSKEIISKFLHITEQEPSPVAVHCKAGLGRTGTLIGLYAMKHYQFPARAFIGWNRICRPGSILGPQQQFLCDMQQDMFQLGAFVRPLPAPLADGTDRAVHGITQQVERMSLNGGRLEEFADPGQGERLCNAKRKVRGDSTFAGIDAMPPVGHTASNGSMGSQQHQQQQHMMRNGSNGTQPIRASSAYTCAAVGGAAANSSMGGMLKRGLQGVRSAFSGSNSSSETSPC